MCIPKIYKHGLVGQVVLQDLSLGSENLYDAKMEFCSMKLVKDNYSF